ncbi:MAG: trypsin-like peptidase domain-containing protein [Thermoplasmata archaeon]|nr:trypsin-like peptidase domain-containing protein [Thermoplasmata archaeon]
MALAAQQDELVAAVATLTPSVVRIVRTTERRRHHRLGEEVAAGTGFVVDDRGHVVTNYHLVRGGGVLQVTYADGSALTGELVGSDPLTDLALLRVVRKGPAPVGFADSDRLRVGQFALAIGNSLGLPGSPSVSLGVVSAVGRPLPWASHVLEGLVQTDAAINPGNSGGPLADLAGKVIGVNTAIVPFAQGVGFAIPSNTVRYVVDAILERGRVVRPWLGIQAVTRLDGDGSHGRPVGVYVAEVVERGPAGQAGIQPGDVIVRIGPYPVLQLHDLLVALSRVPIGGAVDVTIRRGAAEHTTIVRIVEAPATEAAAATAEAGSG